MCWFFLVGFQDESIFVEILIQVEKILFILNYYFFGLDQFVDDIHSKWFSFLKYLFYNQDHQRQSQYLQISTKLAIYEFSSSLCKKLICYYRPKI